MPNAVRNLWPLLTGALLGGAVAGMPGILGGGMGGWLAGIGARHRALAPAWWWGLGIERGRRRLLAAVFALSGRLAKADGRVSEHEIDAARAIMDELGMDRRSRRRAMAAFRAGRDCARPALWLLPALGRGPAVAERRRRCLALLVRVAVADGAPAAGQQRLLVHIAVRLGQGPEAVRALLREARPAPVALPGEDLAAAYARLGLAATASDAEVTRAYRRALGCEHPDRVQGAGGSPDSVRAAAARVAELRAAYERIRRARGGR